MIVFWGEGSGCIYIEKTLWRGEEGKLSKEDEKGKMGRTLINDKTKKRTMKMLAMQIKLTWIKNEVN